MGYSWALLAASDVNLSSLESQPHFIASSAGRRIEWKKLKQFHLWMIHWKILHLLIFMDDSLEDPPFIDIYGWFTGKSSIYGYLWMILLHLWMIHWKILHLWMIFCWFSLETTIFDGDFPATSPCWPSPEGAEGVFLPTCTQRPASDGAAGRWEMGVFHKVTRVVSSVSGWVLPKVDQSGNNVLVILWCFFFGHFWKEDFTPIRSFGPKRDLGKSKSAKSSRGKSAKETSDMICY